MNSMANLDVQASLPPYLKIWVKSVDPPRITKVLVEGGADVDDICSAAAVVFERGRLAITPHDSMRNELCRSTSAIALLEQGIGVDAQSAVVFTGAGIA